MTNSRFFITLPETALSEEELGLLRKGTIRRLQDRIAERAQGGQPNDGDEYWCADHSPDDDNSYPLRTLAYGEAHRPALVAAVQRHLESWLPRQLTKEVLSNTLIADELYDELCGYATFPAVAHRNWLFVVSQAIRELVVAKANMQLRRLKDLSAAETALPSSGPTSIAATEADAEASAGPTNLAKAVHWPYGVLCRDQALRQLAQDNPQLAELYQLASFAEVSPEVLAEIYGNQNDEHAPQSVGDIERLLGYAHKRICEIETALEVERQQMKA